MTNDEEIIALALESGFMLSTAHGQDANKLMPVSDTATLIKFARALLRPVNQEMLEALKGLKHRLQTSGINLSSVSLITDIDKAILSAESGKI